MEAEFDKTSFGMQRRRRDADKLEELRQLVVERIGFTKDEKKSLRLQRLRNAIDAVLLDLND